MNVKDRIVELRRVRAAELLPHPQNWRRHPPEQQDAMRGVLAEIGYADALLARKLDDGRLQLIDGHLRAETTPEATVPVLVLDVDEAEAKRLLATHDPLAELAEADGEKLSALLSEVDFQSAAVTAMLDQLQQHTAGTSGNADEVSIDESYQVVVECSDEVHQRDVYERLSADGLRCRLLTL